MRTHGRPTKDHDVKASFDEVARQWRDLASQVEQIGLDEACTKQATNARPVAQLARSWLFISSASLEAKS